MESNLWLVYAVVTTLALVDWQLETDTRWRDRRVENSAAGLI